MKTFIPQFTGKVINGEIVYLHPKERNKYIAKLEGKDIQEIIEKFTENRTLAQNRRHWGYLVGAIIDVTGEDRARVHRLLRKRFLTFTEPDFDGTIITTTKSSTELNKDEFTEFMRDVEIFAGELGIIINDKL